MLVIQKLGAASDDNEMHDLPLPAGNAGKLMGECGLILKPMEAAGSPYHLIECDQTDFIRRLDKKLKSALNYPNNVEEFLSDFIEYLEEDEEEKILIKALQPTRTSSNALEKSRGPVQESAVRLLLQIEDLQTKLIGWLLERLAIISLNENEPSPTTNRMEIGCQNKAINKPQLILSQLRWLDRIVDGDALTNKFLEILDATSDHVSQEVIACLPEVIAEVSNHEKVAKFLKDKLDSGGFIQIAGSMTNVILDALTNLTLSSDVTTDIQTSILKSMDSFSMEDRPVLVKFILHSTVDNTEANVVCQLRENLHLEQSKLFTQLSATQRGIFRKRRTTNIESSNEDDVVLIMDIIRISMTKSKKMADAWFRAVEVGARTFSSNKKDNFQKHKPLDIFILLLLHGLPHRKRPVESLLKNKIRNGDFSEDLFHKAFLQHKIALRSHFETLHQLAECLLQCGNEPALVRFSTILHREMFLNFDRYCQQEIVGDLVTTISSCGISGSFTGISDLSSGNGASVRSSALSSLKYLAQNHTVMMSTYSHYVAHVLVYLDTMNLGQVRQVMDIISLLSYAISNRANTVKDDLHIMVTKQLTVGGGSNSTSIKNRVKRMGIIGAVILVKNMSIAAMREVDGRVETSRPSQDTSTGSTSMPSEILKQAIDLLERVQSATKNSGELAGLFMDELSNVVQNGKIAPELVEWISSKMAEEFENIFVDDFSNEDLNEIDERANKNFYVPMSIQYNLENSLQDTESEEPQVNIVIDLNKKQKSSEKCKGWTENNFKSNNSNFCASVDRFIPHFRLLSVCIANKHNGNLGDIDALLGCPLWLPQRKTVLERFDTLSNNERNHVCTLLFSALNWFRELLNAFSSQFSMNQIPEDKNKVLFRLKGIRRVLKDLTDCLKYNTNYIPPKALHLADISTWKPLSVQLSSKGKGAKNISKKIKGTGKGKKRKELADNTNIQAITHLEENMTLAPLGHDGPNEVIVPDEPETKSSAIDMDHYQPFFRELDMHTFDILKYDKISTNSQDCEYEAQNDNVELSPSDLLFLLKDLSLKLEHSLVAAKTKKFTGFGGGRSSIKEIGFSKLDNLGPLVIATKAVDLLNCLLTDVEVIAQNFKNILDETDGVLDFGHGLFDNPQVIVLVQSMERIFAIITSIFAWTGFSSKDQRTLLKQALVKIAERTPNQRWTEHNSLLELIEVSLKRLSEFSVAVIDIASADALIKLVEAVAEHTSKCSQASHEVEQGLRIRREIIYKLCKGFLQRAWLNPVTGEREKGSQYNFHVEAMLKIYLNNHPVEGMGLDAIKTYVTSCVLMVVLKLSTEKGAGSKDEEATSSKEYPTFSRSTFLIHYRDLFHHLVSSVKDNVTFGATKDAMEQLSIWIEVVQQFHGKVLE